MSYVINCAVCSKPFTKFSNKSTETKCSDCKGPTYQRQNRRVQTNTAATRFGDRVKALEEVTINFDETMQAWGDSMIVEINTKVEEKFAEIASGPLLDALKPERDQQFAELDERVRSHIATLNSRMKAFIDKVDAEITELKEAVSCLDADKIASSYYTAVITAHEDIKGGKVRSKPLNNESRNALMAGAIDYLKENPGRSKADMLTTIWYGMPTGVASRLLGKMKECDLIFSKGSRRNMVYHAMEE